MNLARSLSAGVLALVASTTLVLAQAANPAPTTYAYGPAGQAISPISGGLLGAYSKSLQSGTIAAGLAAGSPVYSFRYGGSGIAVIRKVTISMAELTGSAGGLASAQMFAARAFTASDTGGTAGTLTGNNSKLRTSLATMGVSDIRVASTGTLSAGTRTLDTDPMGAVVIPLTTTANTGGFASSDIYRPQNAGDYPLELANNEGFVIQLTVPITGTEVVAVTVDWEEYTAFAP